ncbi:22609_t:CDS:2, partial [Racocetra persica]
HELGENPRYKNWWQLHSRTALALSLLSGIDNEALSVASLYTGSFGSLSAPYSREANTRISYATIFIIIIEDVAQFIFLVIYQKVTIIPAIVPILALSSCTALIAIRAISMMYLAFFYQHSLFDCYDNDEVFEEEDSEVLDVKNVIQGSLEDKSSSSVEKKNRPFYSYGSEIAKVLNVIKCKYSYSNMQFDWTITGKYNRSDKSHLMTWVIDKDIDGNCHKILVSKNNCAPVSFDGNYLGSYLLPNDDLIVIAT